MERLELERTVVAMLLADKKHLATSISSGLTETHFSDPFLARSLLALRAIWAKGQEIDPVSVANVIGREHLPALAGLRREAPPTRNFEPFLEAILNLQRQAAIEAKLVDISKALTYRKALEPLEPILEQLAGLVTLGQGHARSVKTTPIAETLAKSLTNVEDRVVANGKGESPGIPTGFAALDKAIYGFQPGFIYVLGARTAMGKTTMALNMAATAARAGYRTAFVTVEMSDVDLTDKLLAKASPVNIGRFLSGTLTANELDQILAGAGELRDLPLLLTEVLRPEFDALAFEVMRLVRVEQVKLVVIDYLQLFEMGDGKFRPSREEAKMVSARLKGLARQLNVPILVLSQLNRQAPEDGEPELVHIAESDQIARDADYVLFLYRHGTDYFLSLGKNRRGPKIAMQLTAELQYSSFKAHEWSPYAD